MRCFLCQTLISNELLYVEHISNDSCHGLLPGWQFILILSSKKKKSVHFKMKEEYFLVYLTHLLFLIMQWHVKYF